MTSEELVLRDPSQCCPSASRRTIKEESVDPDAITIGVDTHRDLNVAVALSAQGLVLGSLGVPSSRAGHARLLSWAYGLGRVQRVGIEGTGSYGAGLTRYLAAAGLTVIEVDRPLSPRAASRRQDGSHRCRAGRAGGALR